MKKVVLINHSDSRGGASVVTFRLMEALCRLGVDARMIVTHKESGSMRVDQAGPGWLRKGAFLAESADNYVRSGFERGNVFKISTAKYGLPLHKHPWVQEADAINLNWVNQGMLTLEEIKRMHAMGKRIVWTMHDQWNLSGVCHHTGDCERWQSECGNCPLLRDGRCRKDLSTAVFRRKQRLYESVPIRFVAVSSWLAERCSRSALMHDAKVWTVGNAFPVEEFGVRPTLSRQECGLPEDGLLITMGAARLDDEVKNLPLAVETLNAVTTPGAHAVFFGAMRDAHALDGLRMPHTVLGPVKDRRMLANIYAHSAAVLSTSRFETLPGTLIEGMAAGAMPVSTGHGGQSDIVEHGVTGFIAGEDDARLLASYVERALDNPARRESQHAAVAQRFSADAVARRYCEILFNP